MTSLTINAAVAANHTKAQAFLQTFFKYLPYALKRRETMFNIDRKAKVRQSHNNEQVKALYRDFLGSPNSEKAHHLLHTFYNDRKAELELTVKEIWGEIKMSTMIY